MKFAYGPLSSETVATRGLQSARSLARGAVGDEFAVAREVFQLFHELRGGFDHMDAWTARELARPRLAKESRVEKHASPLRERQTGLHAGPAGVAGLDDHSP